MKWRSPDSLSPAWMVEATPTSSRRVGGEMLTIGDCRASPGGTFELAHRHRRAPAIGHDFELVHQSPGAWQPQPQAAGRGESVYHGAWDVGNAGTLVPGHDRDSRSRVVIDMVKRDLPAPRVHEDVARDLGDRGGDDGLIPGRKAELGSQLPPHLPGADDVLVRGDFEAPAVSYHVRHGRALVHSRTRAPPRDRARSRRPSTTGPAAPSRTPLRAESPR